MSMARQIQDDSVDETIPLSKLLRKFHLLATRNGRQDLAGWARRETNGYDPSGDIPSYRLVQGLESYGHFNGAYGRRLENGRIPSHALPEEIRKQIGTLKLVAGVAEYEDILANSSEGAFRIDWPASLIASVGLNIYDDMACLGAWRMLPRGSLVRVINVVRSMVFDASREIEATEGIEKAESRMPTNEVFVVHGHDEIKHTVARFLENAGLRPILLDEQPNRGLTVLEKLEAHSNAAFAVILLTPDDVGSAKGAASLSPRARQNVVLELGYFLAKLGRSHVTALYVPSVELPSDIHGLLYVQLDSFGGWQDKLRNELREAGLPIRVAR